MKLEDVKIPALNADYELVEVPLGPSVIRRGGKISISAEDGRGAADYYGEFRGGYPWIAPAIEKWAEENGYFLEWENPGSVGVYKL